MEAGSSTFPSNRDRFEALESSTLWMKEQMAETTTNMTHMQGAITSVTNATEENMKAVEGMRRDLQAILARLGGGANGANRGQTPRVEEEQLVDGRETHISKSTKGEPRPRQPLRLGGRVENEHEVVERWLREEESDRDVDNHARMEERFGGSRYGEEMPYGRIHEDARRHERPRRDHHYHDEDEGNRFNHRGPRRPHYRGGDYEDDDGNRFNNRGPRRPKIDFPKFNGGDPHEWLDKADHYFHIYEVPRTERVATACFFLDGKASKWWRWIRAQYEKEGRRLGWTAFEKELLMQFGPSPIINHHGQLAKLKQDGKVHAYVEEFRQLQTLVRGWSEEALIGTFVDGLKPWIAKELKLKQPTRLQEAMRMAEILEESHHFEKRHVKDQVANKVYKPLYSTGSWKGKEGTTGDSRSKGKEVKKLSREELDEYIKKGLCFKCGEKWSRDHQCKKAKVMCMIGIEEEQLGETSEEEHGHEESSSDEESEEAELSLNAMSGVQKPSTMRLMAWVGKHEMTLLVDSGSTHNFINSRVLSKVGLHGEEVEPFDVKVANGEKLRCEMVVRTVKMNVQGVRIAADLHVLSLVGLDVVLGNAWLRGIGKVVTDYEKMTMEFKLGGKKRTWTALASKEPRPCEANMFEKLCKGGAHCFAIVMGQNRGDEGQEEKYNDGNEKLPQGVKTVLERHKEVLEVPTSLPPSREFDHRIVLKDASKPVNVPPYRYAHFQKGEIERQVEEMLASGLIRPSTSPFSSPVLLVRKKDGS